MADTQAWSGGEADDADVVEQTMPADPVDDEAPAESESEGPAIALEANDADVVEQATDVGSDDPDEYPPGDR